mmetsp:Transcript_54289/g.139859  ORF Transcript_54289/g.139859 Transcript_54289/m.139859 type:complete len:417 (+) Transcript_54289:1490-2740(+)
MRELAVLGLGTVHRAVLRLRKRASARDAAALAVLPDEAFALAQLRAARGLRPLGPLLELTVHGLALGVAGRVGAGGHVDLPAGARHGLVAREEGAFPTFLWRRPRHRQLALHHLRRVPTGGAAVAKAGPLRPHTVRLLLPSTRAVADLLGGSGLALRSADVGHPLDLAVPVVLASGIGAPAPMGPVAPLAVDALQGIAAQVHVAGGGLGCGAVAWQTVMEVRCQDLAAPGLLTAVARGGADRPLIPRGHHAGDLGLGAAVQRRGLVRRRVARLNPAQGLVRARLAVAAGVRRDGTRALMDTEAVGGAVRPRGPLGELAVHVGLAGRCALAHFVLVLEADRRLAAPVGMPRLLAMAGADRGTAGCGTAGPLVPLTPGAIDALVAGPRVAGDHLGLVLCLACFPTILRHILHHAAPAL